MANENFFFEIQFLAALAVIKARLLVAVLLSNFFFFVSYASAKYDSVLVRDKTCRIYWARSGAYPSLRPSLVGSRGSLVEL
jgi:hypothetical protein